MPHAAPFVGVLFAAATFACTGGPKHSASPDTGAATTPAVSSSSPGEARSGSEPVPDQSGFAVSSIVLYQPDSVLNDRLPNIDAFAAFLKEVGSVAVRVFASRQPPHEFDIVVAIKPGRLARFWFVTSAQPNPHLEESLRSELSKLTVPSVHGGPVAVAIIGSVAGARTSDKAEHFTPPMPAEWSDAVQRAKSDPVRVPEGVLETVWPD